MEGKRLNIYKDDVVSAEQYQPSISLIFHLLLQISFYIFLFFFFFFFSLFSLSLSSLSSLFPLSLLSLSLLSLSSLSLESVFVCGNGKYGRLGLREERNVFRPTEMVTMRGTPVVAADCGELFTTMLTSNGDCYTCGIVGTSEENYLKNPAEFQVPRLLELLSGQPIRCLAAGVTHLVVVVPPNEVYVWGSNLSSTDGVGGGIDSEPDHYVCTRGENSRGGGGGGSVEEEDRPLPELIDVCCGASHTLVLAKGGHMWSWGQANAGELGNNEYVDCLSPTMIQTLDSTQVTIAIAAGGHSCAIMSERRSSTSST